MKGAFFLFPVYKLGFGFFVLLGKAGTGEFLIELINTPRRIHKLHLTCEERVRIAGDLQLNQWVFLTIFPGNRVFRRRTGARQERIA